MICLQKNIIKASQLTWFYRNQILKQQKRKTKHLILYFETKSLVRETNRMHGTYLHFSKTPDLILDNTLIKNQHYIILLKHILNGLRTG